MLLCSQAAGLRALKQLRCTMACVATTSGQCTAGYTYGEKNATQRDRFRFIVEGALSRHAQVHSEFLHVSIYKMLIVWAVMPSLPRQPVSDFWGTRQI